MNRNCGVQSAMAHNDVHYVPGGRLEGESEQVGCFGTCEVSHLDVEVEGSSEDWKCGVDFDG